METLFLHGGEKGKRLAPAISCQPATCSSNCRPTARLPLTSTAKVWTWRPCAATPATAHLPQRPPPHLLPHLVPRAPWRMMCWASGPWGMGCWRSWWKVWRGWRRRWKACRSWLRVQVSRLLRSKVRHRARACCAWGSGARGVQPLMLFCTAPDAEPCLAAGLLVSLSSCERAAGCQWDAMWVLPRFSVSVESHA